MTAVSAENGSGVQLICDSCGNVASTDGCGLQDAVVVYVAVAAIGWAGSGFASGPHRCPDCLPLAAPSAASADRVAVLDRVRVEQLPTAAVVRVTGEIDMAVAPELRSALEAAVGAHPNVIVDLSQAGVIDSAGLSTLVRARNAARRRQGQLLLAGPSRFVQTVLRTMRLHTAFRTFGTVQQAVLATHGTGGSPIDRARARATGS
jgi:anti-anti-sigma factor